MNPPQQEKDITATTTTTNNNTELRAAVQYAVQLLTCPMEDPTVTTNAVVTTVVVPWRISPSALLALSELTYQYTQHCFAPDLHSFCQHAKRKCITEADVLLVVRKNTEVQQLVRDKLVEYANSSEVLCRPKKAATRKQRTTTTSTAKTKLTTRTNKRDTSFSSSSSSSSSLGSTSSSEAEMKRDVVQRQPNTKYIPTSMFDGSSDDEDMRMVGLDRVKETIPQSTNPKKAIQQRIKRSSDDSSSSSSSIENSKEEGDRNIKPISKRKKILPSRFRLPNIKETQKNDRSTTKINMLDTSSENDETEDEEKEEAEKSKKQNNRSILGNSSDDNGGTSAPTDKKSRVRDIIDNMSMDSLPDDEESTFDLY